MKVLSVLPALLSAVAAYDASDFKYTCQVTGALSSIMQYHYPASTWCAPYVKTPEAGSVVTATATSMDISTVFTTTVTVTDTATSTSTTTSVCLTARDVELPSTTELDLKPRWAQAATSTFMTTAASYPPAEVSKACSCVVTPSATDKTVTVTTTETTTTEEASTVKAATTTVVTTTTVESC